MTECFVCLGDEPPLLTGLCACTDRALHPACQRALVRKTPKADTQFASVCGACKQQYANVELRWVRRLSPRGIVVAMATALSVVSLGGGVSELVCYGQLAKREVRAFVWMVALGVFLLGVGVCSAGVAAAQLHTARRSGQAMRDVFFSAQVRVRMRRA